MRLPSSASLSDSQIESLLDMVTEVRTALEDANLDAATERTGELYDQLREAQKTAHIRDAREWLDAALSDDPLLVDLQTADAYLTSWADVTDNDADNPELDQYRERVAELRQNKATALQVRGVIAHCDEILANANELESGNEPPHPNFMMDNYYEKVKAIALSAQSEYSDRADLDRMVQRVERIYSQKETADQIYEMALQHRKFSNALHNLDQLPDDTLIPHYTATETSDGDIKLQYQTMIDIDTAREEIRQLAKEWATETTQTAIKEANQQLDAHDPTQAVGTLELSENVNKFLSDDLQTELNDIQTRAKKTERDRQKAYERGEKAIELADEKPLAAWDTYASAYHLYQWADNITEARQAVLNAMRSALQDMLKQADDAFHQERDMEKVRQLYQRARNNYTDKDNSLNDLINDLAEYNEMTKHFDEYVQSGRSILQQVRDVLWDDAVAANDLLSQVESYPEIVLEELSEAYDLRQTVNQRLNADHQHSDLYPMIYNENVDDVRKAINNVQEAVQEFPNDDRFKELLQTLQGHFGYLSAKEQAAAGEPNKALQLLGPVLNKPNHPDYSAAQQLRNQLGAPTNGE